jgi:hypothetical protein
MPPRPLGKVAHERGPANEKRVLEACKLEAHPMWILRARAATRIEDGSGIDIVVVTDVGNLSIQVKSSRRGKAHFRARPFLNVPVVVVRDGDSPSVLLNKVVAELGPIRANHLKALEKLGVKRAIAPEREPPPRAKATPPKARPMQTPSTVMDGPTPAEASWTELRDCLLAALLDPPSPPMTDEGLRIATEELAKRSVRLDEIVRRFPRIFHRAEDGSLATTFDLVQAYRVRLARCWQPVPRGNVYQRMPYRCMHCSLVRADARVFKCPRCGRVDVIAGSAGNLSPGVAVSAAGGKVVSLSANIVAKAVVRAKPGWRYEFTGRDPPLACLS